MDRQDGQDYLAPILLVLFILVDDRNCEIMECDNLARRLIG